MSTSTPVQEFTQEELATILGFEPDEVKLNSSGKYSERQKKRLRAWALIYCLSALFSGIVTISAFNNTLSWIASSQQSGLVLSIGRTLLSVMGTCFFVFVAIRITMMKPQIKSRTGIMSTVPGWINFRKNALSVKKMGFNINWTTKNMGMPAQKYEGYVKAYYFVLVPGIFRPILSAEPWFDEPETEA